MPAAVLSLLPMAGCAAMMLLCARMMRGHHQTPEAAASEVDELRAEVATLRARLEERTQADASPRVR